MRAMLILVSEIVLCSGFNLEIVYFLNNPTPYCRHFPDLTMAGLADSLRPEKFSGAYFKRWQVKVTNWLTTMKVFWVSAGMPEGNISEEDLRRF